MRNTITLFMWGYQPHFAAKIERLAEKILEELGVQMRPEVLLVGILNTGETGYPVCVEPEDGKWNLTLFDDLPERYAKAIKEHPLQRMFYGDEPSNRDKPENIRRGSATQVVREALADFDSENSVKSFCGAARLVGKYYVVPVIQVPTSLFQRFPPLRLPQTEDRFRPQGECGLVHSCLSVLLNEASRELLDPEPGRSVTNSMRAATEIVAAGAEHFMRVPDLLTSTQGYGSGDLFQRLNIISSLFYEGAGGVGSLVLVKPNNPHIDYLVRFETPVPFRESRWARKILAMASPDIALIASQGQIYGLGRLGPDYNPKGFDAFTINFLDHYQWELKCGDTSLMYSRYREPRLPQPPIEPERFKNNLRRLFPNATREDTDRYWTLFEIGSNLGHGSMLVVAEDAASEARRLADQGTAIKPTTMTPELLERVSGIDGTILLDPSGTCHAIGVILDGDATKECSPARGSRFNSALRYVNSASKQRMAIVFSDDRTVDILPLLNPQIEKAEVETHVSMLEGATIDNYHVHRNWLDEHRFYLDPKQCDRVNAALRRLEPIVINAMQIWLELRKFESDPELNETYFL